MTGIKNNMHINQAAYTIFPNPAEGSLFVIPNALMKTDVIRIINVEGKEMIREKLAGKDKIKIDVSSLPQGIYIIKSENDILYSKYIAIVK